MPGSMFDGKYCSQSCAAKITNSNREVTWGEKTRKTIMEYFENNTDFYKTDWKDYKAYRKKVDRYSIQQLKDKKPKLYKYWQSNPYKNDGDTSKLSLEHITPVKYYYDNKLSIQEAGDISNLEIIPYYENHRRQQEYKTFEKSI
jgi:hypothetical protein|tara:strand:+ start:3099 stop:3530 length:432 start_codon:yes stop_codon:yes gene_type:complete